MQLNRSTFESPKSDDYDLFMQWFKNNYPNFFELFSTYIQLDKDGITAIEISGEGKLDDEEYQSLLSIIKLFKKQQLQNNNL